MATSDYFLRPAERKDVETIRQLVVDLASYENQQDAVKATPELLEQYLFDTPYAHALLAFSGSPDSPGPPIGLALYFFNYSTWTGRPGLYVEDLFVKPEYRRKGIGKSFFAQLGRIAQEKNCARMDWAVLKWNRPSIEFYESALHARLMSEWVGMRLDEEGIGGLINQGR